MSAWTKFATNFFHQKQKQNSEYKFSQALKEASKLYKKTKGGSSKKQRGGLTPEEAEADADDTSAVEKKYSVSGDTIIEDPAGMTLIELGETLELANDVLKTKYNSLPGVTKMLPVISVSEIKIKVDAEGNKILKDGKTQECDPSSDEYNDNTKCMPTTTGGKKSKRKSKKAGKKSQKKAKKAGSKKSKK